MSKLVRDRYFWYVVGLLVIAAIFTYSFQGYVVKGSSSESRNDMELLLTLFQNGLLVVAVVIAAWQYKFRGGLVTAVVIGLMLLPNLIADMTNGFRPGHLSIYLIGMVTGVFLSWLISRGKKMQEQLISQERQAFIGQMVSGAAHEINNPLTSVIGFSELILQKELADDVKADLTIINNEAKRAAKIVNNLHIFVQKQTQEKQAIDVNETIQAALQLRSHEIEESNIKVHTRLGPPSQIIGNASQLQQVFLNIIINAQQAMEEAHNKGVLTITIEQVNGIVRVSFTDDGPGIRPENMKRLFTPFFTTKGVGKGTGLGLSICQGIVNEHGGKIYAESEIGKGAAFIVELPAKQN